jgi:hypothetical protein
MSSNTFFEYSGFEYAGWNRPEHTIVTQTENRNELYEKGFSIIPNFINPTLVKKLLTYYDSQHSISVKNGGFFVSIYSKDLQYRQKTHKHLLNLLKHQFDTIFTDHKYTCLNYAVKYPGPDGELFIHQDMAQVNEFEFSQVGIWIPLVDVSVKNGTLGILPYSHYTIPPHRSLYHKLPYSQMYDKVFNYLQPVNLKAGDLLLFDTRLLHNSFINSSKNYRPSIASSIVPVQADFTMTYRDESFAENEFEHLLLDDDFFLTFKDFKSEKVGKPGNSTGQFSTIKEHFVKEDEFLKFCKHHHLYPSNVNPIKTQQVINSIQEPNHRESEPTKASILSRLKRILSNQV